MKPSQNIQWGSIAISLESLSFLDRVFLAACLAAVLALTFPHFSAAQTLSETPFVFELDPVNFQDYLYQYEAANQALETAFLENNLPLAADWPVDPRLKPITEYLISKNSPLAGHAGILLKQYHYRLILGIAFAESNFCKHQIMPNNCWGIGGGNPESYPTLPDGIVRANELIQKYQSNGMTTPKFMRNTWVGWQNDDWIVAVEMVTQELESLGL